MTASRRERFVLGAAIFAALVRLFNVFRLQPVSWDEIEFFRATDWIRQGLVPYRDFWEHHTPLQWFVFAPFAALTDSVDASAVVLLRAAQIPLWIATFACMSLWMHGAGIGRFARWSAIAFAVASSFLMLPAVEYRVDALGCAAFAAGLLLQQRARYAAAGFAFACAGLANMRLGPLLALACIAAVIITPRALVRFSAGVAAGLGGFVAVLFATGALPDFLTSVLRENALSDKYNTITHGNFLHRILIVFGYRVISEGMPRFDLSVIDLGGAAIVVLGTVGLVLALRRERWRDERFVLAVLTLANLAVVARMKIVHNYHFITVIVMLLPFIALAIERLGRDRLIAGIVLAATLGGSAAAFFRGKEDDRAYEDFIMREVHRRTRPGDKVFDGVGWALRREPAYRYWFLPELVRQLEKRDLLRARYGAAEARRDPPAAFIADLNAIRYLRDRPELKAFLLSHYLPRWHELWMPAMSARLTPEAPAAEWVVPADGAYRIYASPVLASHPWFRGGGQLEVTLPAAPRVEGAALQFDAPVNGGVLRLQKKQRLRVVARTAQPLGLFLVPGDDLTLFRQPPPGVSLDSLALRVTHVPRF